MPNTDVCADHLERVIRKSGAVAHAGLVLREHHEEIKARIAELEAREGELLRALGESINSPKGVVPASAEPFYDGQRGTVNK